MSSASEQANGRASGPVLTSVFFFVPDHSAAGGRGGAGKLNWKRRDGRSREEDKKVLGEEWGEGRGGNNKIMLIKWWTEENSL